MKHLEIVEIKNEYIERLRKTFSYVMKNTNEYSKHNRKYIGIVFKIKNFTYYAPFSSPKEYDYKKDRTPKESSYLVLRMVDLEYNKKLIIGKIVMNCMIPVPLKFIKKINIEYIKDENYKNVLKAEFRWISKNIEYINQTANNVYRIKNSKIVLPFNKIEKFVAKHYKKFIS